MCESCRRGHYLACARAKVTGISFDGGYSEDTMRFSVLTGARPRIEKFPLEKAEEAYAPTTSNEVRLRAVLIP